jgi:hypothetical protein
MATRLRKGPEYVAPDPTRTFGRVKDNVEIATPLGKSGDSMQRHEKECLWIARNAELAAVYKKAVDSFFEGVDPACRKIRWKRDMLINEAVEKGRVAVYKHLNIELKPLSEDIKGRFGPGFELNRSATLLNLVVFGDLRDNALKMASMPETSKIEIKRVYGASEVFCIKVVNGNMQKTLFLKPNSHEPNILARKLLRLFGVLVPEIRNFRYVQNGEKQEYGLAEDIGELDCVENCASLRGLARNQEMARFVSENFDEFCRKLGTVFEVCRMLGIQDRHSRNVYVAKTKQGKIVIGMIDLDVVACYSDSRAYLNAYAGQLHYILNDFDFLLRFGKEVRANPGKIAESVDQDSHTESRIRKRALAKLLASGFLKGADEARDYFSDRKTQKRMLATLNEHDGKFVGLYMNSKGLKRNMEKTGGRVKLNGGSHVVSTKGPNKGRFILDAVGAWERGFLFQLMLDVEKFWRETFMFWDQKLPDWVPRQSGDAGEIATLVYG